MQILRANCFLLWMASGAMGALGWAAGTYGVERLGASAAGAVSTAAYGLAGVLAALAVIGTAAAMRYRPTGS